MELSKFRFSDDDDDSGVGAAAAGATTGDEDDFFLEFVVALLALGAGMRFPMATVSSCCVCLVAFQILVLIPPFHPPFFESASSSSAIVMLFLLLMLMLLLIESIEALVARDSDLSKEASNMDLVVLVVLEELKVDESVDRFEDMELPLGGSLLPFFFVVFLGFFVFLLLLLLVTWSVEISPEGGGAPIIIGVRFPMATSSSPLQTDARASSEDGCKCCGVVDAVDA